MIESEANQKVWKTTGLSRQFIGLAVLIVVAKLVAATREILLARAYGISPLMDAYQFVSTLASWPVSIFFAICSAVLIPAYARARARGPKAFVRLRSQAHSATLVLSLLLSLVWIGACAYTPLLSRGSGFSAETSLYAVNFILPMAATIFCGVYAALLSAECISAHSHGNVMLEATPALVMISFVLLWQTDGETLLLAGTVIGACTTLAVMLPYVAMRMNLAPLTLDFDQSQWSKALVAVAVLLFAQCLQAATSIVDQFWASHLGDGSLSVMGYSNRIFFAVASIVSVAITRTVLPTFAEFHADQTKRENDTALLWSFWLFGLGTCMLLLLWPLAPWLVSVIYERGAFGHNESLRVVSYLQASLLQIPATFSSLVLIQQLLVENKYRALVILAACNLVVKTLGNMALTPIWGLEGLAVSSALMQLCTFALLLFWWFRKRDTR